MTLIEKRAEFEQKLAQLKAQKSAEIEAKVAQYRATLEAEPIPGTEQIAKVIAALNEVIDYEAGVINTIPTHEPVVQVAQHPTPAVDPREAQMAAEFTMTRM